MAVDVTPILKELLASNRGPIPLDPGHRQSPNYGVVASLDWNLLNVVLTFQKNCAYCCMEHGCHLPLFNGKRWERLHQALAAHGMVAPPNLQLQLSCVIEDGAIFFDFSKPDRSRRGWYAFAPARGQTYQIDVVEAGSASGAGIPHGDEK
jgi:hypothetical protein